LEPITSLHDPLGDLEEEAPEEEAKPGQPRLIWLGLGLFVTLVVLWVRLYQLQVINGATYRDQADNNRFREVKIAAPRGVIYDRNHAVLARNRPSYSVGMVPADLPDAATRAAVLQRLAELLNVPAAQLNQIANAAAASPFEFVALATNVPENVAYAIDERHRDLPGVTIQLDPTREYPLGPSAAAIVGYVGRITDLQYQRLKDDTAHHYTPDDVIGQNGLERTFEAQLRGEPGQEQMEVDATGRQVQTLQVTSPTSGQNLILTIDAGLQQAIYETLSANLNRYGTASVVALDPRNGQVLALVHAPTYDDNLFATGIGDSDYQKLINDPRHPLVDGAVGAAYPPGATFQAITAAAALESSVITDGTRLDCPGFITVPNRFDPTVGTKLLDSKAFGQQNVVSALADACNVFFYQAGAGDPNGRLAGVGVDGLAHFAQMFGLGDPTGIDLVEEVAGTVPSVRWKRQNLNQEWVPMDTYQLAVGQGYLTATPIQMANVAATIANGGTLYRPQLVLQTTDQQGAVVSDYQPDIVRRLSISANALALIRQGMADGTRTGQTADGTSFDGASKAAAVDGWSVAGTTGTVEFGTPDSSGNLPTHGWFVGFAPAENPTIALAVFVERGTGPADAASIARQVFAYYHQEGSH
jgi:penicillin-binding protein 2